MKKYIIILCLITLSSFSQVGVNTVTPNAMLDIQSTNNGVLIPRVALTSITDVATVINPAGGPLTTSTLVYNTATIGVSPNNVIPGFYYWNNTPSRWIPIVNSVGWELDGNTAITSPAAPATYGTSTIGTTENFMGTTDANDVTIGTNNIERMRVKTTSGNVGIGTANPTSVVEIVGNGTPELKLSSRGAFGPTRFSMISDKELPDEWRPTYIESADNGSFTGRMDFFTNGTGIANKFGSLRSMSITNGKVGIGTINPSEKLNVFDNANANKNSIFSEARQSSATNDYQNIAIKGFSTGSGATRYGYSNGIMGIADQANSFHATGVYAHLGSTTPILPATNQALYANGNSIGSAGVFMDGYVGIGTPNPSNLLHVNSGSTGAVRIVDGSQAANRVLTSDANGVATWRTSALTAIAGNLVLSGFGISIPYTQTTGFLQTFSSISLPPGRYLVTVTMLLSVFPSLTPNDSSFWLRTAFSDSNLANPARTLDTVGNYYISGNIPGSSRFSILTGSVIINNTTAANKTYYYIAGEALTNNTTQSLLNFSGWGEDSIVAYRLN